MRAPVASARRLQGGLSYVEVVVATILVVVALVPAMNALQGATIGSGVHQSEAVKQQQLQSKMEEVLARPFGELYAQTYLAGGNTVAPNAALSDGAVVGRRVVVLYRFSGSALTSADSGLLRIQVGFDAGGPTLDTLKGRWW